MTEVSASAFRATDPGIFFTKGDPADPRVGEMATRWNSAAGEALDFAGFAARHGSSGVALAGYADDEGIRLSGGRIGAAQAPTEVRRHLYRMTPSWLSNSKPAILDLGDMVPERAPSLAERHETARALAREAMTSGLRWLGIGGGHDYGYADAAGFADFCADRGERPLTINFDAHLDVRPYRKSDGSAFYSSGTPFSRWLDAFPESDLMEIGLQGQCNARAHLDWLFARGGRALFVEELEASGRPLVQAAADVLDDWLERRRPAFISVDIDAFSNAWAPGCSQSFATGLSPNSFFPLLQILLKRLDVRALGIYETSPPLDEGGRTCKLAAQILHRALFPT